MKDKQIQSGRAFAGNAAFNLFSLVAPLLFAFVATPLLVRGLGVEEYGYYSLVLAIIGSGFTTGIGRIPVKYVPEKRAAGRRSELEPLLSSTIVITFAVGFVEALILAAASQFLVSGVLNVPLADAVDLTYAIYLACLIGPLMMLSQIFQSTLQGVHRFRTYSLITVAASLIMNVGSVVLALEGFLYKHIIVWNLVVTALAAAAFLIVARAEVPELRIRLKIDVDALRKVAWFAGSIFVYQSITSVYYLFERSFVLRNFGPEALTYFTIPLMLGIYLHGLILAFSNVAIPKFNERLSSRSALAATYKTLTKLVVAAAVFLTLVYYFLGAELLVLWLGEDFAAKSFQLLVIHGTAFALIAVLIPAWSLSEAARKPGLNASSPLITSLVGMVAIVSLTSVYQIEGAAAGRLLGALAAVPIICVVEHLVFREIMWKLWLEIAGRIGAASLVMFILERSITVRLGVSWLALASSFIILSVGYWATLFLFGLVKRSEISSAFGPPANVEDPAKFTIAVQ